MTKLALGLLCLLCLAACGCAGAATPKASCPNPPPLPAAHAAKVHLRLTEARPHAHSRWRDGTPYEGSLLIGHVEIARGSRKKREFDIGRNRLLVDRIVDARVGGYPVNYGFVPGTLAHDGDPLDVLVLGPPRPAGHVARGRVVGVMHMRDEKGYDGKIVIVPDGERTSGARPSAAEQRQTGAFFAGYKRFEQGKRSQVTGWGSACEARKLIALTSLERFRRGEGPPG